MKINAKHILFIAIILSLIIIPKIAFSTNDLHDSFNYSNSALAQTAINEEKMELYPYENAGNSINRHANGWSVRWVVTSSIASLSLVTGLSPRDLQSLPICAIGILIMAYLVASKLTKNWKLASLYCVMIAFDPTVNSLTNGTYIQGWGFIFYFMLIYVAMVIVEKKYYLALSKNKEHYEPFLMYGALAACALMMMHFSYYSALIYAAILLSVVASCIFFVNSNKTLNSKHVFMFITCMAIAFIALYFVEDSIRFAISNYQGPLSKFFTYAEDVFVTGGARFCVGLLSYIFIFIPITILGLKWLRLFIKKRKIPMMKWEDIFVSSFLLTGVINIIIYAGLGFVDFKYFIMFFSLSALYAISRIKLPKFDLAHRIPRKLPIKQVFTMILVFLFVMKFAVYFAPINNSIDEKTEEQWIADYCLYPGTESISDIRVSGEIMLLHTERGNSIFNSFVYSTNYLTRLTSGNATQFLVVNGKITYLIMNEENIDGHFSIGNWEAWSSSESVTEIVGNYQFIQKIYASPKISVWHISI